MPKVAKPPQNEGQTKLEKPRKAPKNSKNGSPRRVSTKLAKRTVTYPQPELKMHRGKVGLSAIDAKKLLGWTLETENVKFGNDFLIKDNDGNKVRCLNNLRNRPLVMAQVNTLLQEILRGMWVLNGEPLIIGETGIVLGGQHTLCALILATEKWAAAQGQWQKMWPEAPRIDKIIVYGIKEDDKTANTLDTARPRSLSDVMYRSSYFHDVEKKDRVKLSRMLDHAIKLMWYRTGAAMEAFAKFRTHAESLDFLDRHHRLLECVMHVYEENGMKNRIAKFISPGYASALMYLMAACNTEQTNDKGTGYIDTEYPNEDRVDFKYWDKAEEFWVLLAGGNSAVAEPIKRAFLLLTEMELLSWENKAATIVRAWNAWHTGKKITPASLELEFAENEHGVEKLVTIPVVEGIDIGKPE